LSDDFRLTALQKTAKLPSQLLIIYSIKPMNNFFKQIKLSPKQAGWVVVLSVVFFLVGVFSFKSYQSQVLILVIPKSEVAVSQQAQIFQNLLELPRTLAFYDRLLKNNPNFVDSTASQKPEQRKSRWNQMIQAAQLDKQNSIISISISGDDQMTGELIAGKTAQTFFETASGLYDVKTEIDLRMIEQPVTKTVCPTWPAIAVASVLAGILLAWTCQYLKIFSQKLSVLQEIFRNNPLPSLNFGKKNAEPMPLEALEDLYKSEEATQLNFETRSIAKPNETEKPTALEDENLLANEVEEKTEASTSQQEVANLGVYPNFPEMPVHHKEEAGVPTNLPIGDFEDSFAFPANELPIEAETVSEEKKHHEPTADQLKERLNQLLKGDL